MITYRGAFALFSFLLIGLLTGCGDQTSDTQEGTVRTYYIAADPVVWNMAPEGKNLITDEAFGEDEAFRYGPGDHQIGMTYKKALYREYTDETFTTLKPVDPRWEHLGTLGPLIRAEVGDKIKVVFKNNVHFPVSVHPHGVFYEKDSEGAFYNDNSDANTHKDDFVQPGEIYTYFWNVPERAGPPEGGISSAFWMYHSHSDEFRDVNSGLIGPMIVTRKGMAGENLKPIDVDREFIISFMSIEEGASWFIEENVQTFMPKPEGVTTRRGRFGGYAIVTPEGNDALFHDTLNGYIYGNMPMPTMKVGEKVRWYIMAGTNFEIHAPHWHGNVLTAGNMRLDVMEILTMGMQVADMVPDADGIWMFHCHVSNHFVSGMSGRYQVLP